MPDRTLFGTWVTTPTEELRMTLITSSTATQTGLSLPDFTDGPFSANVLEMVGQLVDFELENVRDDVEKWLSWMLIGGHRPKANPWAVDAGGVNAIRLTQDLLCAALEQYYPAFDFDDRTHFALLERVTRSLPKTAC